jgi:hypothetical protein
MTYPYRFAYIVGVGFFLPLFLLLFNRKEYRTEMLLMGLLTGLVAFFTAPCFLGSYWHPQTLFNLKNGLEDFLFGFFLGSESTVVYPFFLKKPYQEFFIIKAIQNNYRKILSISTISLGIFVVIQLFTHLNPIYGSMLSFVLPTLIIVILRRDLFTTALFTGLFTLLYTCVFYFYFTHLFPGIIQSWWNLERISGLYFVGIPVEELIWFSLAGSFCSVVCKFAFTSPVPKPDSDIRATFEIFKRLIS